MPQKKKLWLLVNVVFLLFTLLLCMVIRLQIQRSVDELSTRVESETENEAQAAGNFALGITTIATAIILFITWCGYGFGAILLSLSLLVLWIRLQQGKNTKQRRWLLCGIVAKLFFLATSVFLLHVLPFPLSLVLVGVLTGLSLISIPLDCLYCKNIYAVEPLAQNPNP